MAKSATRRLQRLEQYAIIDDPNDYDALVNEPTEPAYTENPLIAMRAKASSTNSPLKQSEYASLLGVNKSVVAAAEEAMFQLIPSAYRQRIVDIKEVNRHYQLHRKTKRRYLFQSELFPETPAKTKPMKALLDHFEMVPWSFGAKACVHHIDIWKMTTDATQATQNFVEFLEHVRLLETYPHWLGQFNKALRSDNPTKLVV